MIETKDGIDNLEEIVTTPGLGGVYIGPADLGYALGLGPIGNADHPLHIETMAKILDACKRHGVPCGTHTGGLADSRRRLKEGFNFVTLNSDGGFMMQAAASDLAAVRQSQETKREATGY